MPTPAFWEQDIYRVKPDHKELNMVEGLCIRDKADNSKNDSILAVLQVGTKINLNLDLHDENHDWYAVSNLAEGYSSIPELKSIKHTQGETQADILGWIFIGKEVTSQEFEILELKAHEKLLSGQSGKINILKKEFRTNWVKSKGLRVRKDKQILSMLPRGTQVKISGEKKAKHYVDLIEIIRDGKPTIPLPKENTQIWFDCLERICRGKKYNEVVVLDTPFPIKAGDLIGHIGHNHSPKISLSRNSIEISCDTNLHIECFTCDDLPNFIAQTRAEADKLPEENKTLLAVSKQAKLLKSPKNEDTKVGQHTGIKVISTDINVKWLQIEITTSATDKKTLWIENSEEISKSITAEGNISLAADKKAWSEYPLQVNELTNNSLIIDFPLLLDINNGVLKKLSHRAIDKDGTLWVYIDHALDKDNLSIQGWLVINKESAKKVSCWDWFDFKLIEEKATLKEFYLDVKKSATRDNASVEAYKPTLKETLAILDRQYYLGQNKYAKIDAKSFNGIIAKPLLSSALSRLVIHYESEWYSEIDAQGKMPKWDAFDSEFYQNERNILSYLEDGDVAKCDAYISTLPENEQQSQKRALELKRRELEKKGINNNKTIEDSFYTDLKLKVASWDNEKEKIKKMLWWDDVVKGLAEQSKSNTESDASNDNTSTSTKVTQPATLSPDGQVWSINPIAMLAFESSRIQKKEVCPIDPNYRSHFVLHCTDVNMSKDAIIKLQSLDNPSQRIRYKAHKYIMQDGEVIEIWPFTEKNVWATKAESIKNLKGRMFHVELNYKVPDGPTELQYQSLANLYIEASDIEGCWPIIVPHIEVDRGIPDSHKDPTDFDYNKFYSILKSRHVPIDSIPHFKHERYWGYFHSKIPYKEDKYSWPPVLEGDPHKK